MEIIIGIICILTLITLWYAYRRKNFRKSHNLPRQSPMKVIKQGSLKVDKIKTYLDLLVKIAACVFLLAITYWLLFDKKEIHIYHHTDELFIRADVNHCEDCSHNEPLKSSWGPEDYVQ